MFARLSMMAVVTFQPLPALRRRAQAGGGRHVGS